MTQPTPTAAKSASPPPCGEGVGVGGRPFTQPSPAPWPDGATRTYGVPGQARDATPPARRMRFSAALLAMLLPLTAQAQIIPTGTPGADILLTQALGEQRVFLTCSALDGVAHPLVLQGWARDVAAATATLTTNAVPADAIAAFTEAARLENLLPTAETPWSEVKQLCDATPDWQTTYAQLRFTILEVQLPRVFE